MRQRFLSSLADVVCRRPWLFIFGGITLALLATFHTVRHLEFKTSRNDLIGRDSEYWRLFSEYAQEFHSEEDYIIVVESDSPKRNQQAIDAIVESLLSQENNPHSEDNPIAQHFSSEDVFFRADFDAMEQRFLYFLSVEDLIEIRDSLKDFQQLVSILEQNPSLATFFDAMNQMLQQMETTSEAQRRRMEAFLPTVTAIIKQMGEPDTNGRSSDLLSPWASVFFSDEMLSEAQQQLQWKGYNVFSRGKMFAILIHPRIKTDYASTEQHAATITKLRRIIDKSRTDFSDLRIGLTGEPVLDYDEMAASQSDAQRATLVTLVLIAILFSLSTREILRPFLGLITIVLAVAISMGYATIVVGHLNIITITFAVMILGLGVDLGIQLIARYEEELNNGATRMHAVRLTIEKTGPSIITAGLTNAAAFFVMGLSGFRGVIELGIIAGGGMVIATALTIFVLPALLLVIYRKHESSHIPAQATATRFEQLLLRRPSFMLIVSGFITIGALYIGSGARFDYNVLNLQSRGLESVETELRLLQADAQSTIYTAVVCNSLEEGRKLHQQLETLPTVSSVASIIPLIPEDQEEKLKIIRVIQNQVGNPQLPKLDDIQIDPQPVLLSLTKLRLRAKSLSKAAIERADQLAVTVLETFINQIQDTRTALQALEASTLQTHLAQFQARFFHDLQIQLQLLASQNTSGPMTMQDVPAEIRRMLIGKTGKILLRVFPKHNIWEREPLSAFVEDVRSIAPHATGTPLGIYEFVGVLQQGYVRAAFWAFIAIIILVMIDFRTIFATLLTVLPLVVGVIWTGGIITAVGISFNPANIIVLPLIVGIGVAYGIYVVQRFREDRNAEFYRKSTGRAVVLSALTTSIAFFSLVFGSHRGIQSLGIVMTIGVTTCFIAALVLLPALLELARRKDWKI